MGLLDLFLQNQSNLDITPIPPQGNGPIEPATGEFNTGATPFQQVWDSNNTYINSFTGGNNEGIQPPTLAETGLDIDNPTFVPSTTTPNTLTAYPATALGGLGQSALQFIQIWTPIINYNDIVVGAGTSPLEQSLDETGLDIENQNAVPTTTIPNTPTQYPSLASGEFGGGTSQYTQIYNPNNTYLSNIAIEDPNSPQIPTLGQTGLDIENQNAVPTTTTPDTPTQYPSLASGEFGGSAGQYNQNYTPSNTYLNSNFTNVQQGTLDNTGLDNTDTNAIPTTTTPTQVPATPQQLPPQTFMGEFQGAPSQFTPQYNPNPGQGYLNTFNTIISNAGNPQVNTLGQTGLDNLNNNSAPTTVQNIDPTSYPLFVQGEFNSSPNLFNQIWGPNFGYYLNSNPSAQIDTLEQTGLDIENQNAVPTTYAVSQVDNITVYPANATGEYNGPALPYAQTYSPAPGFTYEDFVVNAVNGPTSIIENSLAYTGLDIENEDAAPTTYAVPQTDNTTVYPPEVTGELGLAPSPYSQEWEPTNKYYNFMKANYQAQ